MKTRHVLSVLVEDHPGVLNRVVSLLRRRSFNIESITVGHSEQPGVSRMTIVVNGRDEEVEQAGKQLYQLGAIAPLALLLAAGAVEAFTTGAAVLAGIAALAAGWRFKFVLVVRASFNQGFALPRVPVRGAK